MSNGTQLEAAAVTQIANVSRLLRDAINEAIPVSPEQYLTIAIPGTVIDVRNITDGGTFVYGKEYAAFPPPQVRQAEARLADNMAPLSSVMVGTTGKSVARSYSRALDGLVPKKATVRSGESADGVINPIRSPGEPSYDLAMTYLTTIDPVTDQTPVEVYQEKQAAWADAQEEWDQAKLAAQKRAQSKYPKDPVKQRQDYDEWNQANFRKYKFAVQGRWMDWVSNGHKYDVEFNFGMVDTESIMARVESSKESMRNSTIVDADGANEVWTVDLTPKNWATLCQQKQEGWFKRNGDFSIDQLDAEIQRLDRLSRSYAALKEAATLPTPPTATAGGTSGAPAAGGASGAPATGGASGASGASGTGGASGASGTGGASGAPPASSDPTYPLASPAANTTDGAKPTVTEETSDTALQTAFKKLYDAEGELAYANAEAREDPTKTADITTAAANLKTARAALDTAIKQNMKNHSDTTKFNLGRLTSEAKTSLGKWLKVKLDIIADQRDKLVQKRSTKASSQPIGIPTVIGASADNGKQGTVFATEGSELADPAFRVNPPSSDVQSQNGAAASTAPVAGSESDPWVNISTSYSAEDQKSTSNSSSWGMSVGGGFGYGLWSVGGSYAHDQTQSDSQSDMAKCDVSINFDALVVNVGRPWLYAELFNDFELDVADHIKLSPGAVQLKQLMLKQVPSTISLTDPGKADQSILSELAQYNSFPAFPTSFLIAANTVLEFTGDTQHIEDHFSAQSNSGSLSVGYGPWSVSSSFHQSSSEQTHQMQSTATGCKITFGAPQIIGWVSQIIPALPRPKGLEPMVQNLVESLA